MHLHRPDGGVVDLHVDLRILIWLISEILEAGVEHSRSMGRQSPSTLSRPPLI